MRLNSQKGFTLIELMVVVAIIGILAAIAIPNFLTYQSKAKQSEAKINLKGLFTSEQSYFSNQNTFGTLSSINYLPSGNPKYAMAVGLVSDKANPNDELIPPSGAGILVDGSVGPTCTNNATGGGIFSATGFTAEAWSKISAIGYQDIWQTNDLNLLCNAQQGY
jgi:type IV pilus assembly protein PilA